jgi:hypothetical protein
MPTLRVVEPLEVVEHIGADLLRDGCKSMYVARVGAPDPERRTSSIFDEFKDTRPVLKSKPTPAISTTGFTRWARLEQGSLPRVESSRKEGRGLGFLEPI